MQLTEPHTVIKAIESSWVEPPHFSLIIDKLRPVFIHYNESQMNFIYFTEHYILFFLLIGIYTWILKLKNNYKWLSANELTVEQFLACAVLLPFPDRVATQAPLSLILCRYVCPDGRAWQVIHIYPFPPRVARMVLSTGKDGVKYSAGLIEFNI